MQIQQTIVDITIEHPNIICSVIGLCLTTFIYIIKNEVFRKIVKKLFNKTDIKVIQESYPLINRLTSIVIWLIGGSYILTNLGLNINQILTTLGASSLIIAYGFKDALTNIICGLVIMSDKPFRKYDEIKIPTGERVKVLNIGLRRCKFLFDPDESELTETVIIVPNSQIAKHQIYNYTYAEELRNVNI